MNYSKKIAFTASQDVKERDYWLNKLSGKLAKNCFPRDLKKTAGNGDEPPEKDAVHFRLQGSLFSRLIHLSNHSDFRLHIVMVTGIVALLHKYTGSEDILVGIPTYKQDVEGELINTVLVLRNQVKTGIIFKELLLQVVQTIWEANENQNYPIETLLYKLGVPLLKEDFPLFDTAVLLENIHDKGYLQYVNPNMIFSFLRTGEYIEGVVEYHPLLFDKITIEIIINHFTVLLQQAIIDINRSLPGMNIVSEKEKKQLLIEFNDNNADFSKDKTIYHFIEKYSDITPGQTAILFEGNEVSYRTLNQRANRLARVLREKGIQPDNPVGILLNRSPRMAESILAIWKAGGAYIPMDPDYPVKRIIEILKDSKTKVLLTCSQYIDDQLVAACSDIIVDLDKHSNEIQKRDTSNPGFDLDMNSLAYIIYTSGSTGKPKGVMVEHIGMMNHIWAKINDLHLSTKSVVAQNAPHTFDISVWQFFTALIQGGKTVIYPNPLVLEVGQFIHRIIEDRVTILEVVPSYLSVILETLEPGKFRSLDYLIVTGESLKPDLITRWFTKFPGIKMVNAYGPTEASDDITHHIMDKPPAVDRITIGKPVQNFNIYIVDENMQLSPLRVKGEICVSGIGVGRGYLNNPELTVERFLNGPRITRIDTKKVNKKFLRGVQGGSFFKKSPSGRRRQSVYKTGDLGCWLPDGTIEFFGRKDHQVKIRGFRIELGEIENRLVNHENVKEAVVIDWDNEGSKYLCAYLVPREQLHIPAIKAYLEKNLPDYMVPAYFVQLTHMPLTANGKIDRKALPEPQLRSDSQELMPYITAQMLESITVPVSKENATLRTDITNDHTKEKYQHTLSTKELEQLLLDFNETNPHYPKNKTVHQVFQEQVEKTPHPIAVSYDNHQLTYKKLNETANGLAGVLRAKGVGADGIVGVMAECCVEAVVAAVGTLKAGGAYMPIGTKYPQERIKYILQDSRARILLVNTDYSPSTYTPPVIDLRNDENYSQEGSNLPSISSPTDLAHIFYTSGTTGNPKGSMNVHLNVNHFVFGLEEKVLSKYGAGLRICQLAPFVFDAFVQQAVAALLSGHTLFILPEDMRFYGDQLLKFYQRFGIDISDGTPTHIRLLLETMRGNTFQAYVKNFIIGGEVLPKKVVEDFFACFEGQPPGITNVYGPTECCGDSTFIRVDRESIDMWENIPIGKSMPNEKVYILDREKDLVPIGVSGEIFISGDGVARGYMNNPELTAEKFCLRRPGDSFCKNHPLDPRKNFLLKGTRGQRIHGKEGLLERALLSSELYTRPYALGPRLYKTGDLARWMPDGNIDFIGRIDHQVQMMGVRIELGEIENTLLKYDGIKEAAVIVKKAAEANTFEDKYLYAFVVSDQPFKKSELRDYLLTELPDYMVPSYFARVEKMPLTPNGKVNRKLLEAVDVKIETGIEYTAPRDKVEEKLADIWSEVLNLKKEIIGIDANFFDLGGHSLKAIILVSKIHKEMDIKVPLVEMFETPSIRGLAQYLKNTREDKYTPIRPVEAKGYYPLSSAQKRLYFLYRMDTRSISYNTPTVVRFEGMLQKEAVEKNFNLLIQRHETLRTSFHPHEDEIVQRVHHDIAFKTAYYQAAEDGVKSIINRFIRPFDLEHAPLLRLGLVKIEAQNHIMMIDMHHIITDGMSAAVFLNDLMAISRGKTLSPLRIQYKDYAQWQTSEKRRNEIKNQEDYWLKEFAEEIPVLALPYEYPRPTVQSFEGSAVSFTISADETSALKELASEKEVTLFMALLALFNILLAKLSNQEDIVIGTPIAGRRHTDLENIIGMFVNTLALRNKPEGARTFNTFLPEVKKRVLQAYENQDYPFEDLVEKAAVYRDASRNPLFDVMFVLQNVEIAKVKIRGLRIEPYEYDSKISKFDLELHAVETAKIVVLSFAYSAKLFKKETIERFIVYFKRILAAVLHEPAKKISDLEVVSEEEKNQLLYDFNDTNSGFPKDKTIHELFEEQTDKSPGNTAITEVNPEPVPGTGKKQFNYRELNEKSNEVAQRLKEKGIHPDGIVGVMIDRSIDMIISLLGILKSGGAYLPIDPVYPEERIKFMLADSGAEVLLTTKKLANKARFEKETIFIDEKGIYQQDIYNLENVNNPADLVYIIYTSGTTGKPKGVMIEHRNLVRLMVNDRYLFDFNSSDIWTMFHSYSFDFSVWEMYGALLSGGKLVVIPALVSKDTGRFLEILQEENVTILNQTPSAFYTLSMQELERPGRKLRLRYVIFGGEALRPIQLKGWKEKYPETRLINMFGITETTVHVTFKEIEEKDIQPHISNIGKPIPTLTTYILDRNLKLSPIGVAGEVCVGGAGVGRGYLNRPELTAEKFVEQVTCTGGRCRCIDKKYLWWVGAKRQAPCAKRLPPGHRRQNIYKSGDLGKWLGNGDLEYLGRVDHQVKIRGFRIEPGEIENLLLKHDRIKEAVVISRENTGRKSLGGNNSDSRDRYLCAYIVPHSLETENHINTLGLREYLSRHLADYMIPAHFVRLEKMPLTVNGKVDRKALPEPELGSEGEYEAPRDPIEKRLSAIWSEVLFIEKGRIGIDSNFFELGGNSLKTTLLTAKIHKQFGANVPLTEIFTTPTIRGISRYIKGSERCEYIPLEPVEKKDYYAVSSAQKRLYILHRMEPDNLSYNMLQTVNLGGTVDKYRLEDTFSRLLRRHESLRTSFEMIKGEPVQRIHDSVDFRIQYLTAGKKSEGAPVNPGDSIISVDEIVGNYNRPFDLTLAPILRVALIHTHPHSCGHGHPSQEERDQKYILMVDMHHIVSDGTSHDILVSEFMALYEGKDLAGLRIHYKDYSEWINKEAQRKSVNKQEEYWLKTFARKIPVLTLPTDHARPEMQSFEGSTISFAISREETLRLKALALEKESTLFMVLLALFYVLLSKISGQEDIVIGTGVEGRTHEDLRQIIGIFVNTLALRQYPEGEKTFVEFLKEIKEGTLAAFEHQDYPFEKLVDQVVVHRDTSRNPLFDVMFQFQTAQNQGVKIRTLKINPYKNHIKMSKFDLTLWGLEAEETLFFIFEYCTRLFEEETIKKIITYFRTIIMSVLANPCQRLLNIEMLTEEEKENELSQFTDNLEMDGIGAK